MDDLDLNLDFNVNIANLIQKLSFELENYIKWIKCRNILTDNFTPEDNHILYLKYNQEVSRILEKYGSSHYNDIDLHGRTVLFYILFDECAENVEKLIQKKDVNIKDKYGFFLFDIAIYNGATRIVEIILKTGYQFENVNKTIFNGKSALHIAAGKNNLPLVKLLLEYGADPKVRDHWNLLPEDEAGKEEIKEYLKNYQDLPS